MAKSPADAGPSRSSPYSAEDFLGEKPFCDIVMKGGITSGVVYPLAMVELARCYRVKNVGGASAGAIAAAITAAAEYARASGGYLKLADIADEASRRLLSLFQPTPAVRPLFDAFLATLAAHTTAGRVRAGLARLFTRSPATTVLGLAPALVLAALAFYVNQPLALLGVPFVALFGLAIAFAVRLLGVFRELPKQGFGFCAGLQQPGYSEPGLTEWLADKIDAVAGIGANASHPLTFGDLSNRGINLEIITTDVTGGRPHRIPFATNVFMFRPDEFAGLFPARIVKWMVDNSNPIVDGSQFRWLPRAEKLPVVFAVRMSLSFPILLSAVPLHARDFTYEKDEEKQKPRRCWFSDGGICSNFPIHFFDSIWPRWPTFGITLERYQVGHGRDRVWLPTKAGEGILGKFAPIDSLGGFLSSMLDTMQEWRDNLQTTSPGYRDRVVHIGLDPDEGGLNLSMPPDLVARLTERGREAGMRLCADFDWDAHRWKRYVMSIAKLEEALKQMAHAYSVAPQEGESLADLLARYADEPASYKQTALWRQIAEQRTSVLAEVGAQWRQEPTLDGENIPKPEVNLRMTPKV